MMAIVWGLLFGICYWIFKKDKKASIVLGLCVLSHWFLDLIVHFQDLPLFPGKSPLVGFGLWKSTPWTLVVEGGIFIFGTTLYLKATKAKNKIGKIGFWVLPLVVFLSTPWTLVVEGGIFIFGTTLYLKATKAKNKIGKIGFWVLILLLVSMYAWSFSGPPPPNVNTLAWSAQLQWIFILLAYWVDKNRTIL